MSSLFIIAVLFVVFLLLVLGVWVFSGGRPSGNHRGERASLAKAFYLLTQGKNDEVLAELKQAILDGANAAELYIIMAVLYRRRGELNKAIHLNEGLMLRSDLSRTGMTVVLKELVKCYRAADTLNKAEEWLAQVPESVDDPELTLIRADLHSYKGEHDSAIRKYQKYAKISGNSANTEIAREYIAMAQESEDSSAKGKALKNATKYDADNINIYFELADMSFASGRSSAGMQEIAAIVNRELIRTKEDLKRVEEAYFQHSSLDELHKLMSEKVLESSEDPAPYLYLSDSYVKKGNTEKGMQILKDYITEHGRKAVIVKAYAKLSGDPVLLKISQVKDNYRCSVCGKQYSTYTDVCSKCGTIHSLIYI